MLKSTMELSDSFGRIAKKLRISVTDRCNMRCVYCMPHNNTSWLNQKNILAFDQITSLARIFASLGIEKIKITGGEPLVRDNIRSLISSLSSIEGIISISMTTNGLLLKDKLTGLKEAGLDSINISLDTFDHRRFKLMSGIDGLDTVMSSIKLAVSQNIRVKINTVIMRGWNDDEISEFVKFSKKMGCPVKFIEFMPLDGTRIWSENLVVSEDEMIKKINNNFGKLSPLDNDKADPARLYRFNEGNATIGFIPTITKPFCQDCDRVRITADGKLHTCLFEKENYDLKALLDQGKSNEDIREYIRKCVMEKPEGIIKIIRTHSLKPGLNNMHTIGG
ncbi:GTP 3',8-cyclase MoaA [Candidatus Nitrosocosmicus hydrocola]|uniref:GTP 3',8-cyclase MoaA n=1 Tax=Candidatus Nitrosocosmicus hydrocola TaxID=1826872 RepID=UPI0011E5BC87|nr:GTP 3',8-cyclase MoaA [Candidatus Nitrosocosmicus hydrocola]